MQAKDIPDDLFVRAVAECSVQTAKTWNRPNAWCNRWDVTEWLTRTLSVDVPEKVVLAKARAVIKKGRMEGCACGCRGDFDLRGKPDDPFVVAGIDARRRPQRA